MVPNRFLGRTVGCRPMPLLPTLLYCLALIAPQNTEGSDCDQRSLVSEKMVWRKSPKQSSSYLWFLQWPFSFSEAPNVMVALRSLSIS